ncbi:MAG: amino acid adenylation domain-containing protein, partial [Acidimicrobiia bacterium]|nr:amino acid adenylation domain-containing protein [Acidimicrobiia bacterium]
MRVPTVAAGDAVNCPLAVRADRPSGEADARSRERTLVGMFKKTASAHPKAVALQAGRDLVTYTELDAAASQLAEQLRASGVGPGDRVGIRIRAGTAELYLAILGVLFAGACYVPVDAEDPETRAMTAWSAADVGHVITDGLVVTRLGRKRTRDARGLKIDDDAWVIFTSGSTGTPKAVAVTHAAATAFVDGESDLFNVGPQDRVAAGLSVAFDASCEEMWLAWRHGATLVVAPRLVVRSGIDFGPWLLAHGITVVSTVPTLAALWDDTVPAGLRLVILGGEACPDALAWRLAAHCTVWNTYGPTEATVVSTAARMAVGQPVGIGQPLPGWEVAVVDEGGRAVRTGEEGELVIAGVGLGRYLDAELDAERFAPLPSCGWGRAYRTGDIVRETCDGLVFIGRRDGQVKLAGRRVELGEIDTQLLVLPGVRAAASAVRRTPNGAQVLVGYVCGAVDLERARAQLSTRLPDTLVPVLVPIDRLPSTRAGKIDRDALPWPVATVQDASVLTETAAWLAEHWKAELGPWALSGDSNFFELGGTSIAVARLVSTLRTRFPSAAVADVYANPRLGDLARRLEELAPAPPPRDDAPSAQRRGWTAAQLGGVIIVLALRAPVVILALLAYNNITGGVSGPHAPWVWLAATWLVLVSPPGRAGMLIVLRRVLLRDLSPGRYPRYGSLALRVWFVGQVASAYRLQSLAGTPWATRYARLSGATVGDDVYLGTLPPPTALISVGNGATVESGVDLHGWWFEGRHLVIGTVAIGDRARVGARSVLMPGSHIGADAEVEAGSVVDGVVPAGERWQGCPARRMNVENEGRWPEHAPPAVHSRRWRYMYAVGLTAQVALPAAVALPALAIFAQIDGASHLASW